MAGLLARGSLPSSVFPAMPLKARASDVNGRRLTAYSRGGGWASDQTWPYPFPFHPGAFSLPDTMGRRSFGRRGAAVKVKPQADAKVAHLDDVEQVSETLILLATSALL
jgi:hypothetical protein